MPFISYAQNFEDVLLHRVFGGQGTGFYVDVGAFDPVVGSVTKSFYDRGWSGINVEPGSVFANLVVARPRDVNLQIAVSDRAGEIAFVENSIDRGTSHIILDGSEADVAQMVPCDTLQAIVTAYAGGRVIDFVKIDAEGAEAAIVQSTDWHQLRPRILLLEATRPWSNVLVNQDWEPTLLKQGYVRAYFDGINCFYVPEEHASLLLPYFQIPVNVLDDVVRYDTAVACDRLNKAEANVARLSMEREALQAALNQKHSEVACLITERDKVCVALEEKNAAAAWLADAIRPLVQARDDSVLVELRRLIGEMERTLLTLALERTP